MLSHYSENQPRAHGEIPQKNGLKKLKKRTALCLVRALEVRMDLDPDGENAYTQVVFNTIQQRIL